MTGLTLQYVPYNELAHLSSEKKINKLLDLAKKRKIVLMQGKLKPYEETQLIQKTMESVNKEFKGIELCTIFPEKRNQHFFAILKSVLTKILIGSSSSGITIIGPATVIKEIKRNPNKIELLTYSAYTLRKNGKK